MHLSHEQNCYFSVIVFPQVIRSTFALPWLTNLLLLKQKLKNAETISEEVLEQRQQELEEKFPERKELDLDAPWQMDLLKLQRKVK